MIERVRYEETHHRKGKDAWPDPWKVMRVHFPIVERLRDTPRSTWRHPDELPSSLVHLAESFHDAGWDDLARRAYYEVIDLRREAGESVDLRRALTALRTLLIDNEQYEEALPVAEDELRLAAKLAVEGDYSTEVANSARYWVLDLLGELGRHEESARVAGEDVAALRTQRPVKNGPPPGYGLAHALREHATRLTRIGELERAAENLGEAAEFWRHAKGEAIRLYNVLNDLSTLQLRLGRFDECRASHAEAVAVIRKRARTDEFRGHLAAALNNHANRLHDLGLDEEAVKAAEESVKRYRALLAKAEGRAKVTQLELRLALVLVGLGSRLHDVGRFDESLAASDEAIAFASRHEDRESGRAELARAWSNRASLLISRHAYREAAEAAARGIELYDIADGKAMARNTFALASALAGELGTALEASLRSVAEYREWHAEDPEEYACLLADALCDHAEIRRLRSETGEAEAAIAESLALYEMLAAANPARFRRELDRAREVAARL
ncbi:hypothetical protein [Lentzea sp. NPDC059081]|uniref:hypothetical protein n=1 Tax=Lentzea sp. NPDC059081 TaxID=3346719 RepID=UPI003693390E